MKISIFAYTKQGCNQAALIAESLQIKSVEPTYVMDGTESNEVRCFTTERHKRDGFLLIEKGDGFYGRHFSEDDALIFVGATGIAVREIAPYVRDKMTDPAVISVDEKGEYIIPILSGHIGGANALSERIAGALGGTAVITTATDINGKFSVDSWANRKGFIIGNREAAKQVSSAILEKEILLKSDIVIRGKLPEDVKEVKECRKEECEKSAGIYLGWKKEKPFGITLEIVPRILHLGIGCRRGVEKEKIESFVKKTFLENSIDERAVSSIASIDIKSKETGLLSLAEVFGLPIEFYSAEELNNVRGDFEKSNFVENVTGVDNVCERAAVLSAIKAYEKKNHQDADKTWADGEEEKARLVIHKTTEAGITLAVAEEYMEVDFE